MTYVSSDDGYWVGLGFEKMEEDETLRQFKARVAAAIAQMFGSPQECSWYEETIAC